MDTPNSELVLREIVPLKSDFTEEVTQRLEDLTKQAIDEAQVFLLTGTADQRMQIVRALLTGALRAVGSDSGKVEAEARMSLDSLWEHMRQVPDAPPITSIAARTYDPDEITHD